ncbi:PREDICTED: uncharacterized protein LOC108366308, partial [Rhagoletis zephyria]|uniref:uncharacterized protein LOC108366308 n=1 Tax=Rhagoletis zephyria TaxID=28612 RepID=UPI00081133D6
MRNDDFTPLPEIKQNDDHIQRYLIATAIASKNGEEVRPLSSYNVFQIEKGLKHISTEYTEVTELKSGDLLIKTRNLKAAEKFLKATHVDIVPVKITSHKYLNSTQGRIFSRNIIKLSEEELMEGLACQKVIEIRKIMKLTNNVATPTGAAIVTFNLIRRPEKINLGWERVTVQEYIPNPMRCRNCQKLGHTKNTCKNIQLCKQCAFPPPHEICSRIFCANCNVNTHTSEDPTCPSFLKHKSVNKIKAERRCTVREAWKVYNSNPTAYQIEPRNRQTSKLSYAQTARNDQTTAVEQTQIEKSNHISSHITQPSNNIQNQDKTRSLKSNNEIQNKTKPPSNNIQKNTSNSNYGPQLTTTLDQSNQSTSTTASKSSSSPPRTKSNEKNNTHTQSCDMEMSPCSDIYNKYPHLN